MTEVILQDEVEDIEIVEEAYRGVYEKDDTTGKFVLSLHNIPGLRAKSQELLEEKKAAVKRAEEAEKKVQDGVSDPDILNGLKETHATELGSRDAKISGLTRTIEQTMIDNVATSMASELAISGSADLLHGPIAQRLAVEWDDNGKPKVRVLDKDTGQVSKDTIAVLRKQIETDKRFAPVLAKSRAKGGGITANNRGGQQPGGQMTRSQYESLSGPEKAEVMKNGIALVDD